LGFHDIELFNVALLARHEWRILHQPSALSARILKDAGHSGNPNCSGRVSRVKVKSGSRKDTRIACQNFATREFGARYFGSGSGSGFT
jgi:hypothetical protein